MGLEITCFDTSISFFWIIFSFAGACVSPDSVFRLRINTVRHRKRMKTYPNIRLLVPHSKENCGANFFSVKLFPRPTRFLFHNQLKLRTSNIESRFCSGNFSPELCNSQGHVRFSYSKTLWPPYRVQYQNENLLFGSLAFFHLDT